MYLKFLLIIKNQNVYPTTNQNKRKLKKKLTKIIHQPTLKIIKNYIFNALIYFIESNN